METKNSSDYDYLKTDYDHENGTITTTLCSKDGSEYRLTYKPVETEVLGSDHIYIDDKLNQIISKVRVEGVTIKLASGPAQRRMQREKLQQYYIDTTNK